MNVVKLRELRRTLLKAHTDGLLYMSMWASRELGVVKEGSCGTALCAAGWTVVNAGWEIDWSTGGDTSQFCTKDDSQWFIQDAARHELELTPLECQLLFFSVGPLSEQSTEDSEVIRVLDALILWTETNPDLPAISEVIASDYTARSELLHWYDNYSASV